MIRTAVAVGLMTFCAIILPYQFGSGASGADVPQIDAPVTHSHVPGIENYDIRNDRSSSAVDTLAAIRQKSRRGDFALKNVRQEMLAGEESLRSRVPSLVVEYSEDLRAPEVIGTSSGSGRFLSDVSDYGSGKSNAELVRGFIQQNDGLFSLTRSQVNALEVRADYTNPDGNLSYVILSQEINGIPVFRGEVEAMITRRGEIARMINNIAPGLDYSSLRTNAGRPEDAVFAAAKYINLIATDADVRIASLVDGGKSVAFERGQFDSPTTAELMYFPTEPGEATLAWRVLIWERVAAYYVIVDAESGALLWRKNISEDQTQTATYGIYNDDSPTALSPSPNSISPGSGTQGSLINRTIVTLVGNEAPNTFNNLGWITDGGNTTDGNNVVAGIDRDGTNGIDATGSPTGSPNRVFNFAYNPAPGDPPAGDDPVPLTYPPLSDYQSGVVTNLFYWSNVYHDRLYSVGFTEPARNFQNVNFGRGGIEGDRVRGEAQDSAGTNNANFATPSDGGPPRMQMFIFTNLPVRRDGDLDADVFLHELTHGTSNRLIGNGVGLSGGGQAGGMGEGWSDFYARVLLATASEDVNGIFASGGYVTFQFSTIGSANYYYGIRRFPYAVKTNVGGPLGRPHNPLTYADIDPAKLDLSDGAFSPRFVGTANEVHNIGEVWCMMLLEVRARLITRLGFAAGDQRMLQLTTDALKVTPLTPNFIQARDAILAADQAGFANNDYNDIWAGFATRGAGFSASTAGLRVTEAFDLPNLRQSPAFTFSDATGNNNGSAEPGEAIVLSVPIENATLTSATGSTVSVNGGAAVNYGTIAVSQTVTQQINFTVPANQPCGSTLSLSFDINSSLGPVSNVRSLTVGQPIVGFTQSFDGVTAPALPANWSSTVSGSGVLWATSTTSSNSAPNNVFTSDPATAGLAELETPPINISTMAPRISFKNNFITENNFDGMVLEIKIGSGVYQDIITAGGSFVSGGYTGAFSSSGSNPNPLRGREAWSGNSVGYINTVIDLPPSLNGQLVQFKWRMGTDSSVGSTGVRIDDVTIVTAHACGVTTPTTVQFSSASYTVSETGPRIDITLSRSGDTTSSAAVNYATNDAAGLTNCNVFNGTASPRCDYINTLGAISFAAGETSKSFSIAIVDDSYAEGSETFTVGLNNPSGATLGAQSTATVTITDNETTTGPNPIDNTNFFVRQQYIDFLNREPDPPGFTGWVNTINNCTGDTTQCDRIHVSQLFFQSAEFQERGYFVYRFYPVAFGRKPDYAEFVPDLASVSGFLDNNQLEAAKVAFIAAFTARPAFANTYNPLNNTQYVDMLLNTAGVTLSSRQTMINGLTNSTLTRAQVLRQIVESSEVSTKYNHQAYAVMEYFGYLRRQQDGFYLACIAVLYQSNDPRGMVTGFVNSAEYRQRFGP